MANPDEQPSYYDPELEALLAEAPADIQQTVRESIQRLQPIMRPEEWLAIRGVFISDLKSMQVKKRLEQEHAEIEKAMQELEEGMKKLKALQEGIEKLRKLEADTEKLREMEEGMEKLRELEEEMEKLRELKKRLDSLRSE